MRRWLILLVLLSGVFLANLDVFIVVVAMPEIRRSLGAGEAQQQLVLAGYQLVYGLGLIAGGRLGDSAGTLRTFRTGMTLFTLASAACALAPSAGLLVAARLLQGAGTALLVPQVYRSAQTLFTGTARRRALALTGGVMGLGAVCGQLFGGWLLTADPAGLGWRAVFLVNVPVGAAALAVLPWITRRGHNSRAPHAPSRVRLDLPGTGLAALALGLLTGPLLVGGPDGPGPWALPLLAASVPAALWFLRYERAAEALGDDPLLPPRLLRCPGFGRGLAVVALVNCGLNAFVLVLGLLLQQGLGWPPLETGAGMLPAAGAFALASLATPRLRRVPQARALSGAAALAAAGYLGCAASVLTYGTGALLLALGVAGAGLGLLVGPVLAATLHHVPEDISGAASGVVATVQQIGAALGVCALGALFFALRHAGTGFPAAFAVTTAVIAVTTAAGGLLARGLRPAPSPAPATGSPAGPPTGRAEP
ncbi:MFS transporter [Streptomyces sp. HNM0574]|nr:MFS transporter [Streptomyces sp. HNM0574]